MSGAQIIITPHFSAALSSRWCVRHFVYTHNEMQTASGWHISIEPAQHLLLLPAHVQLMGLLSVSKSGGEFVVQEENRSATLRSEINLNK